MFIPYPPVLNYVLIFQCQVLALQSFAALTLVHLVYYFPGKNNYYIYLESEVCQNISLYTYFAKLCGKYTFGLP